MPPRAPSPDVAGRLRPSSHARGLSGRRRAIAALALVAMLAEAGCAGFWDAQRERRRQSWIERARVLVEQGSFDRAFEPIERGQTRRRLGDFAAESIWLKARCLEALGRHEEALAHWRLLHDQYGASPWASRIPEEVEPALGSAETYRARVAPEAFEIPNPRYSEGAQRASVAGAVWVEYRLDEDGDPHDIRVIGRAHPLLAAYAVEAVAAGDWRKSAGENTPLPRRAGSAFRFKSLWMDEAEEEALTDGSETGSPPTEALPAEPEDADSEDDEEWIEWFPQR